MCSKRVASIGVLRKGNTDEGVFNEKSFECRRTAACTRFGRVEIPAYGINSENDNSMWTTTRDGASDCVKRKQKGP